VSKTPATKAHTKKTAAGKASSSASKVGKTAKPNKPVAKKPAAAPAKKSKPLVKAAAKPATKAPAKPVAPTPAAKHAAKPVHKSAPAQAKHSAPVAAAPKPTPPMKSVPSTAPTPKSAAAASAPVAVEPAIKKSSRSAKLSAPMEQAPLPAPTSRFADRFAPPRPPTRQMNNLELDTPREKQKSDPKLANAWKNKSGRDLTEAEVLAMPDSEYMNDKQLEFFRVKLQTLKDDLLSNAGETTEHLREDTSIVPDPADRATIEEEHALELRTRDRERKLLKKISQSLARIESGEYGFCDETGEPIGLGRLIARPTATLSLEAQQRRELKQKMFGD